MTPFRREKRGKYYLDIRWSGHPRIKLSTDTTSKTRATDMERMLHQLRSVGRRDLIALLAERKIRLPELYEAWTERGDELEQLKARAESPRIGDLVDRWIFWMRSPAGISPRTKRRYTPRTIERYKVSWEGFFTVLSLGRNAKLSHLNRGFVLDYRRTRQRAVGGRFRKTVPNKPLSPSTLNRDLAALGAFCTWVTEVEGIAFERPKIPREREPAGLERWLSSDELRGFEEHCPPEWWPFFVTLFYTGARLGEVQGLRSADVLLHAGRITIHERHRRLKTATSTRDVPVADLLRRPLAAHLARLSPGPADLVFPGDFQHYGRLRGVWDSTCKEANIADATPHTARHTFGVDAAMAAIPLVRLQKLMGHASPTMTLRYMKHAPEAFITEDGSAIADHMTGTDKESDARAVAARKGFRKI